ncbi:hypothetical protein GGR88_001537 [Sphingomonas jejuensis]|uniref:Uncharacterized protein n=1 Tax=Sphingomonas jejuensis TaxID=904715 RepID=A0ABX0XL30_9SPHN|nr:hypothetical protein [Sphingomonas jejuensis]NJC34063.1 hypothetical protein [Sphingomonas jejuensis]
MIKRRLVLTNEAARHPFRQRMAPPPRVAVRTDGDDDVRLFLLSFAAFFTAIYGFVA